MDNENKTVGPAQPIKRGSQKTYSKDAFIFQVMAINLFNVPGLPLLPCDVGRNSSLATFSEIHLRMTFYGNDTVVGIVVETLPVHMLLCSLFDLFIYCTPPFPTK